MWVGAVCLVLAGAFLVKYTFDQGLLSPTVRIVLGGAFGVLLLLAGEWMRRRSDRVAQGLSAAGIGDLFAVLLAAVNLYELVSPAFGFALMAAVTALAVVLSLRQGVIVAALGLAGGFTTPILVRTGESTPSVFLYLFMLELGLLAVSHRRHWHVVAGLTLLCSMVWAGGWLFWLYEPAHSPWIGTFVLGTVGVFVIAAQLGRAEETWGHRHVARGLTLLSMALGLFLLAWLLPASDFTPLEWSYLGLLSAGCIALGRIDPKHEGFAWLSCGAAIALLIGWSVAADPLPQLRFGLTVLSFGALFALGAYACLWGSQKPQRWAALCVVSGVAYLLTVYFNLDGPPAGVAWGWICLILAALYTGGAAAIARRRTLNMDWELAFAALLVAVTSFVSLAAPIELERAWITAAWALEVAALGLISIWLPVGVLRILAASLATFVAGRLLLNPWLLEYPLGTHPVLNWLTYGYGVPILAFGVGAWLFRRRADDRLVTGLEGAAIALGLALLTLEIRHYFHPGDLAALPFALREHSSISNAWLLYGLGIFAARRRWARTSLLWGGAVVGVLAVVQVFAVHVIVLNPLWSAQSVGDRVVFNDLLHLYGLPAVLIVLIARRAHGYPETRTLPDPLDAAAIALGFLLVTLEVRHYFTGDRIGDLDVRLNEWGAFSIFWLLYGAGLLWMWTRWRRDVLLWAGGMVAGLAVLEAIVVSGVVQSPLRVHQAVGGGILLNDLLWVYGLPALLVLPVAAPLRRGGEVPAARFFGVGALILMFLLVTLEVRQGFQGAYLDSGEVSNAEMYAYSAAWILFGLSLLLGGIRTGGAVLRYASLVVMLLAIGKVFVLDTRELEDLYRVVSFLGLGVTLLVLAYLYHRFVFARAHPATTVTDAHARGAS